jgi:hypothetical protein
MRPEQSNLVLQGYDTASLDNRIPQLATKQYPHFIVLRRLEASR